MPADAAPAPADAGPPQAATGGAPAGALGRLGAALVIDTNIALDLLVFSDPATADLMSALQAGKVRWIATRAMRDELERVLGYPKLAARIAFHQRDTHTVLAAMDALCDLVADAPKAPATCADADDQKFIDLALAHQAQLLSKDHHITQMRKRLAALGVRIFVTWNPSVA